MEPAVKALKCDLATKDLKAQNVQLPGGVPFCKRSKTITRMEKNMLTKMPTTSFDCWQSNMAMKNGLRTTIQQ